MIENIIDWGVDTVFGLPGDGINGMMEALRTRDGPPAFAPALFTGFAGVGLIAAYFL